MAESFSTGLRNGLLGVNDFKSLMAGGVLAIFGGTKPASADLTEGSSLLMLYTLNSHAFTPGNAAYGLTFDVVSGGVVSKTALETWSGVGLAAAGAVGTTATWFRFYDVNYTTGASTTAVRFDGSIGTSSTYELRMSNTTIVENGPATVSTFTVTFPAA